MAKAKSQEVILRLSQGNLPDGVLQDDLISVRLNKYRKELQTKIKALKVESEELRASRDQVQKDLNEKSEEFAFRNLGPKELVDCLTKIGCKTSHHIGIRYNFDKNKGSSVTFSMRVEVSDEETEKDESGCYPPRRFGIVMMEGNLSAGDGFTFIRKMATPAVLKPILDNLHAITKDYDAMISEKDKLIDELQEIPQKKIELEAALTEMKCQATPEGRAALAQINSIKID